MVCAQVGATLPYFTVLTPHDCTALVALGLLCSRSRPPQVALMRHAVAWYPRLRPRAPNSSYCTASAGTVCHTDKAVANKKVHVRSTVFKFRHFDLHHGKCAQKMGTDSMLLGSWALPPSNSTAILDVGTGTGVLALMMAQKTQQQHSLIHAIDIDEDSYMQAWENFQQSPWAERLLPAHSSFQHWVNACSTKYDMIISNPPYFLQSSKPDASSRAAARHADVLLPFSDLAAGAAELLQPTGRLCLILPAVEAQQFIAAAQQQGLQLINQLKVYTRCQDPEPKRLMMQFEPVYISTTDGSSSSSSVGSSCSSAGIGLPSATAAEKQLVVMEQQVDPVTQQAVHVYSQQYQQLTEDFHHPSMFLPRGG